LSIIRTASAMDRFPRLHSGSKTKSDSTESGLQKKVIRQITWDRIKP